jgi:hypothetical protein
MMQTVRKNDAVHDQFASVLQLIQDLQLAPDAEVEKRKSPIEEATIGAALEKPECSEGSTQQQHRK